MYKTILTVSKTLEEAQSTKKSKKIRIALTVEARHKKIQ